MLSDKTTKGLYKKFQNLVEQLESLKKEHWIALAQKLEIFFLFARCIYSGSVCVDGEDTVIYEHNMLTCAI